MGLDVMSCLYCFLFSAISSVMFNYLPLYLTPSLLWPTYWPPTSSSMSLLSMLFSSLPFTSPNHLYLIFLNLCSRFSTPHLLLTSSSDLFISNPVFLFISTNFQPANCNSITVNYLIFQRCKQMAREFAVMNR